MKTLLYTWLIIFGFISTSFATTQNPIFYKPYYSLSTQSNISSLKNPTYNMPDGFGKSNNEFGYGAGIGVGVRGNIDVSNIGNSNLIGTEADNNRGASTGKLYLGIEAFINIDNIFNKESTTPHYSGNGDDSTEVKINSVLNARANIGYNFNNKFTMFGSIGLKHYEYVSTWKYTDYYDSYYDNFIRYNDWLIAPTFGLGVIYSMSRSFEMVLGYEYSFFTIKDQIFDYPDTEGKVKMKINTIRLGLNYVF